jgi:hypothetical protein
MKMCTRCRPTVPLQGLETIWESRHCTPTYRRPIVAVLFTISCITIAQGWRPAHIYLQRRRAGQTALDSFKIVCRSVLPAPAYHPLLPITRSRSHPEGFDGPQYYLLQELDLDRLADRNEWHLLQWIYGCRFRTSRQAKQADTLIPRRARRAYATLASCPEPARPARLSITAALETTSSRRSADWWSCLASPT